MAVVVRSTVAGDVLVHRRAGWKDLWPGYWDLAVGGVVGVGEPWPAAARRELAEELGVEVVELFELGGFSYEDAKWPSGPGVLGPQRRALPLRGR